MYLVGLTFSILAFRVQIVGLFTSNEKILRLAVSAIWIVSLNTFPDAFKGVQSGVIRGLGI